MLLRNLLWGFHWFAAFCFVLSLLPPRIATGDTLAVAVATALATQAVILACRLRPGRTAPAVYRGNYGDADGVFPTMQPRALDRADAHHAAALEAFTRVASTGTEPVICAARYAEALVRPAEDERTLRAAVDAIASLGIRTSAPDEQPAADRPAEHAADPDPGRSQQFISRGR